MDEEQGYKPPAEFEENAKDPLLDINVDDSTELWLIQWPKNQVCCFFFFFLFQYFGFNANYQEE